MAKERKGNNMKKILLSVLILSLVATYAVSAAAASVSPALDVIANDYAMTVSGICGESVCFKKEQFFDAAGTEKLESIKVQSLPADAEGKLYLYDTPVSVNQIISSSEIENLCFVPEKDAKEAAFTFSPDGSYTMKCSILFDAKENNAPVCNNGICVNTYTSTVCSGKMTAEDADGDALRYEVVKYPENGTLVFEKDTGKFRYTPTNTPGNESFVYRATDEKGAYSEPAGVTLCVNANTTGIAFTDMENNTYAAAAIAMTDKGVMTCNENKGKKTFSPDETVTRLDFLVSAMKVFGAANIPKVKDTGFVDDKDIPEEYKGLVYSAAKLGIVKGVQSGDNLYFYPNKPITPEEASVILNNVIGYVPEKTGENAPSWAKESVAAMKELGVYCAEDGATELSRGESAQMLYGISCMIYE